jgi:hypothetical protein
MMTIPMIDPPLSQLKFAFRKHFAATSPPAGASHAWGESWPMLMVAPRNAALEF